MSTKSGKFPVRKQYIGINKYYKLLLYAVGVFYVIITGYSAITAVFFPKVNFTLFNLAPIVFAIHFPFEWLLIDQTLILVGKRYFKD